MPVALKQNMPWAFGQDCVLYAPMTDLAAMGDEGWTVNGTPDAVDTPWGKGLQFVSASVESVNTRMRTLVSAATLWSLWKGYNAGAVLLGCMNTNHRSLIGMTGGKFGAGVANDSYTTIQGTSLINDDNWHFGAVSYNGTTVNLFIDGAIEYSNPQNGAIIEHGYTYYIAANNNAGAIGGNYNGIIKFCGMFRRALATAELSYIRDSIMGMIP